MVFSSNQLGIKLQVEIDSLRSINLIQSIHGDERRYLQILLNFLSNSLKFTNRNGCIKVIVKILDHQSISTKAPQKRKPSRPKKKNSSNMNNMKYFIESGWNIVNPQPRKTSNLQRVFSHDSS